MSPGTSHMTSHSAPGSFAVNARDAAAASTGVSAVAPVVAPIDVPVSLHGFWPGFELDEWSRAMAFMAGRVRWRLAAPGERPRLVIVSVFASEAGKWSAGGGAVPAGVTSLQFIGESRAPDLDRFDFAMSMSTLADPRHLRWPLWCWNLRAADGSLAALQRPTAMRDAHAAEVRARPGFCAFVVANRSASERLAMFRLLSAHRRVDAAGPVGRNVPAIAPGTLAKREFLCGYRFALVYENRVWPGYCTEKLAEALAAGCVPIYWGDPHAVRDFNPACFLRREDFASDAALAQRVIELDNDAGAFMAMAAQPCFVDDRVPGALSDETARRFIERVLVHAGVLGA